MNENAHHESGYQVRHEHDGALFPTALRLVYVSHTETKCRTVRGRGSPRYQCVRSGRTLNARDSLG